MWQLVLISSIIILVCVGGMILCNKLCKSDRSKYWVLLGASIATVVCHYSNFFIILFQGNDAIGYLRGCPNLLVPIYPCNVMMICLLLFGLKKDKTDPFAHFLIDFSFWFGGISCLVGMFANVDFINNPTLANWEITKSIVAHGFMFFNVLLLPALGYVKISLPRNILNIAISIVLMGLLGLHVNLIFWALTDWDYAHVVNSMFLLHAPFGPEFLTYPFIAGVALVGYFIIFFIAELIAYKKGNRWYNRIKKKSKEA